MKEDLANYIGKRIRKYRKDMKMTQEDLAEKLNTKKGTISNYETGYRTPRQDDLFLLAEILRVSIDDLFPPRENSTRTNKENNNLIRIYNKLVPIRQRRVLDYANAQLSEQNDTNTIKIHEEVSVYGFASAGIGETLHDDVQFTVSIDGYIPSHDLALQVNGDSMEPLFEDKEIIFIEKTTNINNGQIGVFIIDGESFLKKVFVEEDKLRLVSLNKKYDDIYFNDQNDIKLIGKVIL